VIGANSAATVPLGASLPLCGGGHVESSAHCWSQTCTEAYVLALVLLPARDRARECSASLSDVVLALIISGREDRRARWSDRLGSGALVRRSCTTSEPVDPHRRFGVEDGRS
jgi:hypothetical protein